MKAASPSEEEVKERLSMSSRMPPKLPCTGMILDLGNQMRSRCSAVKAGTQSVNLHLRVWVC